MERIIKIKQKILHNKKRIKSLMCLLMAVALFVSLQPMKADALSINGAGTGVVTGSGTETGNYGYRSAEGLLGFRATLVNSLGNTVDGTRPYDIYSSSLNTKTLVRFATKYSKTELISLYQKLNFPLTTTSSSTVYDTYTISVSDWGLSIPASAEAMVDWATKANMRTLLEKAWGSDTNELSSNGWAVLMEPIYELKVKSTWFALTPTEIAIMSVADGSAYSSPTNYWDDVPSAQSSASSWKYVSTYTHGAWPQALTLTKAQAGIDAPSETLSKSNRGTSRQIIEEGYGVMLVYSENLNISKYKVTLDNQNATTAGTPAYWYLYNTTTTINGVTVYYYSDSALTTPLKDGCYIAAPTKTGYTFEGYFSGKDGSGTQYVDANGMCINNLYKTAGNATLYAQWTPNTYKVTLDNQNATTAGTPAYWYLYNTTTTINGVTVYYYSDSALTTPVKDGCYITVPTKTGYTFGGYYSSKDGTGTQYVDANGMCINNLYQTSGDTTLYAQWTPNDGLDQGPEITAMDRWFTLEDAKNDVITLEELMSTATAEDSPIGDVTDFTEKKDNFTILDYSEEDFRSFDKAGSVTVTYWAEDKAGNVALKTITVHIVDKNNSTAISPESGVKKQEIRFISDRYYLDGAGGFIGVSSGGLDASSKWVTDNAYVDALTNTLENTYSDGDWAVKPAYSFTFDIDVIDDIKSFVETNNIGESLGAFYNAFLTQKD